ncbi:hypothetical protein [Burkholderia sp. MSMB1589WGS]|uniref:hypothetical protein n=1 Tax=Burkholderia sp. MSMB1589WGS TaxID=1636425 RepID=UPI0007BA03B0|nr:hypothetical protein [Burkholderia sp. MSMB1589WGS]
MSDMHAPRITQRIFVVPRRSHANHLIVRMIIAVYLLLIFEGAIRKWLLPTMGDLLYFARVPLVFLIYAVALGSGMWPRSNKYMAFGLWFGGLTACLVVLQMVLGGYSERHLIIAAYGWINYFFFIPFAFIIGEQVRGTDLAKIARITIWLSIAVMPLVILQYYSPAESIVVRGSGELETQQYIGLGFSGDRIRPMGLFTSSLGQQVFVASGLAFVTGAWFMRKSQRCVAAATLVAAGFAILIMIGFSGQRGLVIHAAIVFLFSVVGGTALRRRHAGSGLFIAAAALIFSFLYPILFPDVYFEFYERWIDAAWVENISYGGGGILGRMVYQLVHFLSMFDKAPPQGYLLGIGGNATGSLTWVQLPDVANQWSGPTGWAEDGLARHIVELGWFFGPLFIMYRFALAFWLMRQAVRFTRKSGQVLPLALVGFMLPLLIFMQITGQGTLVGYAWIFVGFGMAASRNDNFMNEKTPLRSPVIMSAYTHEIRKT